jgi:hypothetical protein
MEVDEHRRPETLPEALFLAVRRRPSVSSTVLILYVQFFLSQLHQTDRLAQLVRAWC